MKVSIENLSRIKCPLREDPLKGLVFYILRLLKVKRGQFNIYFVDNQRIKRLNRIYLKRNYPTDVIAFNLERYPPEIVSEIFISLSKARENALVYRSSFLSEIILYIIHAILHILGFDHKKKKDKKRMFAKQKDLLSLASGYLSTRYKIKLS